MSPRIGWRPLHRVILAGFGSWAVVVPAATVPAHAQVVHGHLLDTTAGVAVAGAMVTLVSLEGGEEESVITRSGDGFFVLGASAVGHYRLRADRIGYAPTYSNVFWLASGDTVMVNMEASIEPVSLVGIEAQGERRCRVRPEEGLAVNQVWEEARKALAASVWTQEHGSYEYEILRITRDMDPRGRKVVTENRLYGTSRGSAPYLARSADSLVYGGFARVSAEGSRFWAPDAAVLLSDPFLDTHCFRLREGEGAASGLVGLEFEPTPDRGVPDIAGTMWLDPSRAEIRWLDFRYQNLAVPRALSRATPGGRVQFKRLPNGAWIVTSWHVRMFIPGFATHSLTGLRLVTLEGIREERGKVLQVVGEEGVVYRGGAGYVVAGVVLDTLGAGLPNARVFIEGSGAEARTDAEGHFELAHLEPAEYVLQFSHPYLDQLRYRPESKKVRVREGDRHPVEVEFRAPTRRRVFDQICDGEQPPEKQQAIRMHGILMGHLSDDAGQPVGRTKVVVLALAATSADHLPAEWVSVTAETGSSGFYRACWVPVGIPLSVVVLHDNEKFDSSDPAGHTELAHRFADRLRTITILEEAPYRTLDLVRGPRPSRPDPTP